MLVNGIANQLHGGPSSPERPALTVEIPIEDAETATRLKVAAGAAVDDPLPDTAILVCEPDLLDCLMRVEPHLKCALDLCKLVAGSNQVAGSIIHGCSFALNLAKTVHVWRNPNKHAATKEGALVVAPPPKVDTVDPSVICRESVSSLAISGSGLSCSAMLRAAA